MIHHVYTIFDQKAGAYLPPFFMRTDGEAVRAVGDCVAQAGHRFNAHPADYSLWRIGSFDDVAGVLIPLEKHECLAQLVQLVVADPQGSLFTGDPIRNEFEEERV